MTGRGGGEQYGSLQGSVWIPDWPVTAVEITDQIEPGTPVCVYAKNGVLAANSWARREGVTEGMSRRGAHSLCPEAVLVPADPGREATRFEPVLRALDRHIAHVTVIQPGRVLFTAWGAIKAAGSPQLLAEALIGEINDVAGCDALVGFGQGTLPALLASSAGQFITPEHTQPYIDSQPIGCLLSVASSEAMHASLAECVELLGRLGIRTLGDVRSLGRVALGTRFGQTGHLIWRLVCGEDVHVAHRQEAAPEFSSSRSFDPPLDNTEQTVFAAKTLADELGEEMVSRSLAGGRLTITALLVNGDDLQRSWLLDGGSVKDIVDRVRWQLGSWLASGEDGASIARLTLTMEDLLPAGYRPGPLWGGQSVSQQQAEKAAVRLQSLVGEEEVRVPQKVGGRLPRARFSDHAWNEATAEGGQAELPWPGSIPEPSPCILHADPPSVGLEGSCGHDLYVNGEGELACSKGCADPAPAVLRADAENMEIGEFAGPWIIEQRWWDQPTRRAYLQIVGRNAGALIYRETGEWKEEGRYV